LPYILREERLNPSANSAVDFRTIDSKLDSFSPEESVSSGLGPRVLRPNTTRPLVAEESAEIRPCRPAESSARNYIDSPKATFIGSQNLEPVDLSAVRPCWPSKSTLISDLAGEIGPVSRQDPEEETLDTVGPIAMSLGPSSVREGESPSIQRENTPILGVFPVIDPGTPSPKSSLLDFSPKPSPPISLEGSGPLASSLPKAGLQGSLSPVKAGLQGLQGTIPSPLKACLPAIGLGPTGFRRMGENHPRPLYSPSGLLGIRLGPLLGLLGTGLRLLSLGPLGCGPGPPYGLGPLGTGPGPPDLGPFGTGPGPP
jgi:hypothetical protein